jgi:serine/threonine protein kinase
MGILEQMHVLGFIHGDIKSANILIGADEKFKLSFIFFVCCFIFLFISEGQKGAATMNKALFLFFIILVILFYFISLYSIPLFIHLFFMLREYAPPEIMNGERFFFITVLG